MTIQIKFISQRFVKMLTTGAFLVVMLILATRLTVLAAAPQVVGTAPAGQNSVEYIGKIDQVALSLTGYGYITYIYGVPDNVLFTDPINHSEATARFTYFSAAKITARSVIETVFVLNSVGTTTIYYNEKPKGNFKDPKSFTGGTAIADGSERWQSIVNVQAPDTGILTGIGELTQATAMSFAANGQDYVLGKSKMVLRFSFTGEGKRSDKLAPNSSFITAGSATSDGN